MDRLLAACDEIGNVLQLKFSTGIAGGAENLPDGVTPEMEKEWQKANGLQGVVTAPRWSLREVIANGVADAKQPLR
jgi:serine palmitoyltransferase